MSGTRYHLRPPANLRLRRGDGGSAWDGGALAPAMEHLSWTPPTLAGTTLYARDRKTIAAFNLGS